MNWKKLDWQGFNPPHTDEPNDEVHVDHQIQERLFTYSFGERWAKDMELAYFFGQITQDLRWLKLCLKEIWRLLPIPTGNE